MRRPSRRRRMPSILTILLLILGGALLVLLLRHDSGTVGGITTDDFARLAFLLALLIFLGIGVFVQAMRPGEIFRSIAFWFMAIVVLVALHAFRDELAIVGGRVLGALVPGAPIVGRLTGEGDQDAVVIMRSGDGHFGVRAKVNDEPMTLLVDTGASYLTLTEADASDIGIDVAALSFTVPIRTANGVIRAAAAKVDRISIGPIERTQHPGAGCTRGAPSTRACWV